MISAVGTTVFRSISASSDIRSISRFLLATGVGWSGSAHRGCARHVCVCSLDVRIYALCRLNKDKGRALIWNSVTALFTGQNLSTWISKMHCKFKNCIMCVLSTSNVTAPRVCGQLESFSALRDVVLVPLNRLFLIKLNCWSPGLLRTSGNCSTDYQRARLS